MQWLPQPALHPVFETLGYAGGYALYKRERGRRGDFLDDDRRWLIIAAAAIGALVGARLLGIAEEWPRLGFSWRMVLAPGGGKTIVGGLLGGWLGVELAKLCVGIKARTGDLFAVPLCVGIAIGRVGCFFAGMSDDTYGTPTRMPWGVDFGDGVKRHPTQIYEMVFLLVLACVLWWIGRRPHREGMMFRLFLAAYLAWRVVVDFIKPEPLWHGMNVIQWACLAGLVVLGAADVMARRSGDG